MLVVSARLGSCATGGGAHLAILCHVQVVWCSSSSAWLIHGVIHVFSFSLGAQVTWRPTHVVFHERETLLWRQLEKMKRTGSHRRGPTLHPRQPWTTRRRQQLHGRSTTSTDVRRRARRRCLSSSTYASTTTAARVPASSSAPTPPQHDIGGAAGATYTTMTTSELPACSPELSPPCRRAARSHLHHHDNAGAAGVQPGAISSSSNRGRRPEPDHIHEVINCSCPQARRRRPTSKAAPSSTSTREERIHGVHHLQGDACMCLLSFSLSSSYFSVSSGRTEDGFGSGKAECPKGEAT